MPYFFKYDLINLKSLQIDFLCDLAFFFCCFKSTFGFGLSKSRMSLYRFVVDFESLPSMISCYEVKQCFRHLISTVTVSTGKLRNAKQTLHSLFLWHKEQATQTFHRVRQYHLLCCIYLSHFLKNIYFQKQFYCTLLLLEKYFCEVTQLLLVNNFWLCNLSLVATLK